MANNTLITQMVICKHDHAMTEEFSFYDSKIAEQNDRLSSIATPHIAHKIDEKQQVKIKKGHRR
ncbi:TPA: hypothetical protein NPO98_003605 [Klebsiella quasipneumoniae subsp. similipneumoniae]|nr:hypothetical protein [Klebsiella quasipneumoniae subsp. similipneumoniae]